MNKQSLFSMIMFVAISTATAAQTVTLAVRQAEPLDVRLQKQTFDILLGKTLILGDDMLISGGTPPYNIHWSALSVGLDSTSNLLALSPPDTTTVTCTVTDSLGCSLSQIIKVNVVFPLSTKISKSDVSCYGVNNGSIRLLVTGGAGPYAIVWETGEKTDSIGGLAPGTYRVGITDAMGQKADTAIVLAGPPKVTARFSQSICSNQTYRFNGRELTQAGEYTDTLTGITGCDSIITLNLTVNPGYLNSVDAEICQGETYTFRGRQLSAAGQYVDSLATAAGCDSILVCNLIVHDSPEKPIVTVTGDTLTATGAYAYQWFRNNEPINGETGQTLAIAQSGNYKVETHNEHGCTNQSDAHNVIYSTVTGYASPELALKVYPNPSKGLFTIDIETVKDGPIVLELFSVDGRLLAKKQLAGSESSRNIGFGRENLAKGTYTLRVQCGTETVSKKLVVN